MATANDAVKRVKTYLGVRERPPGSNRTIVGQRYGWNGVAWCHELLSLVCSEIGMVKNKDFPWTASTPVGKSWFQSKRRWYQTPQVGDFVYYSNYGRNGSPYHVEMVIAISKYYISTIGGNTSGVAGTIHGNGDGCYGKQVARSASRISGYGRPFYSAQQSNLNGEQMPTYVSVDKTDKSRMEALAKSVWHQVSFDKNSSKGADKHHAKGDFPSFVTGKAYYQGEVYLTLKNFPVGANGQVRAVYIDVKTDDVKASCPTSEFVGTPGMTYVEKSITGYVPAGQKLRIEVSNTDGTGEPTVVGGQVRMMVWEA